MVRAAEHLEQEVMGALVEWMEVATVAEAWVAEGLTAGQSRSRSERHRRRCGSS